MAYLILLRHGESEWNALGIWTGQTDIEMTAKGLEEARRAAEKIAHIEIHVCHTSPLSRAQRTLKEIKKHLQGYDWPTFIHEALTERHYGEYTGKNKWEVRDLLGEERFMLLRRSWDHPVPGGETLKDVHARIVPYFEQQILPSLKEGKNALISFHGNSMRALVKYLEDISEEEIPLLEIATGEVYLYEFDEGGRMINKEIR